MHTHLCFTFAFASSPLPLSTLVFRDLLRPRVEVEGDLSGVSSGFSFSFSPSGSCLSLPEVARFGIVCRLIARLRREALDVPVVSSSATPDMTELFVFDDDLVNSSFSSICKEIRFGEKQDAVDRRR